MPTVILLLHVAATSVVLPAPAVGCCRVCACVCCCCACAGVCCACFSSHVSATVVCCVARICCARSCHYNTDLRSHRVDHLGDSLCGLGGGMWHGWWRAVLNARSAHSSLQGSFMRLPEMIHRLLALFTCTAFARGCCCCCCCLLSLYTHVCCYRLMWRQLVLCVLS
jgi:hypothetical protein